MDQITRRCFVKQLGYGFAAVALGAVTHASQIPPSRPNFVVILADDLGYGDLGCYGNVVIKTPNLDRLAEQGIRLTDCYAASPNCSPARAGLLTGRSPYRVGIYDFKNEKWPDMHLPATETTVTELLRKAGYNTMFAGKWHLGKLSTGSDPTPGDHGFNYWLACEKNFNKNPKTLYRNGQPAGKLSGYQCDILADETISWLENSWDRSKPFCIFFWANEPHTPVTSPPERMKPYETPQARAKAEAIPYGGPQVARAKANPRFRSKYFGCVSNFDAAIGRVMKKLDNLGIAENTLVWFTSDNGPEHRASTSWGSPGLLRGAKGHMHDGGIRVPGIIRWPGRIAPNSVSHEPVNGTDLLPSLCAAAGADIAVDKRLDGANILPALTGQGKVKRNVPMMWWLYHARGGWQVAMRDGDWKMLARMLPQTKKFGDPSDAIPPKGQFFQDFIKKADLGDFQLYNIKKDPRESDELSTKEPTQFAVLRKKMITLHAEIRAEGPIWPGAVKPTPATG
jgi:arylsulfatase A